MYQPGHRRAKGVHSKDLLLSRSLSVASDGAGDEAQQPQHLLEGPDHKQYRLRCQPANRHCFLPLTFLRPPIMLITWQQNLSKLPGNEALTRRIKQIDLCWVYKKPVR